MDKAALARKLLAEGLSVRKFAEKLGMSKSWVQKQTKGGLLMKRLSIPDVTITAGNAEIGKKYRTKIDIPVIVKGRYITGNQIISAAR